MDIENDEDRLSPQERRTVVGVSLGFVLLLGVILVPIFVFTNPSDVVQEVFRQFPRKRSVLTALLCVLVPGVFILFSLTLFQGMRGKRTGATGWLLEQIHHPRAQGAPATDQTEGVTTPNTRGVWARLVEWIPLGAMVLLFAALYLISRANK